MNHARSAFDPPAWTSEGTQPLLDHERLLRRAAEDLADRFAGTFSRETVERCVLDSYRELARTARVLVHLPALTVHFARERLEARARTLGTPVGAVPEVLFVCTQNAGRSQMATALLARRAGGRVTVRSAGTSPATEVDPAVVSVMKEIGVDLGREFPKPLTDDFVAAADIVVTMGCGDACPVLPDKAYRDWVVPDPAGRPVEEVRSIRDDLDRRVQDLLAELLADRVTASG